MEPTNHPFGEENDLTQTSMIMFQPLILRGVAPHLRILHDRKKPYRSQSIIGFFFRKCGVHDGIPCKGSESMDPSMGSESVWQECGFSPVEKY